MLENLSHFLSEDEMVSEKLELVQLERNFDNFQEDVFEYIARFILRKLGLAEHISNEPINTWVDELSIGASTNPTNSF